MERNLYRQILERARHKGDDSINILVVFPAMAFMDAPYWSPGRDFQICMPYRTWLRDNRDGTVDIIATHVTPKTGITAWDGGEWIEPEIWTVRAASGHWWLSSILWDRPHRITHFLNGDVDEGENLLVPSQVIDRRPHAGHPIEAVLEYWDAFSLKHGFTPRRLDTFAGFEDRYGVLTRRGYEGESDLELAMQSLSMLVYNLAKITRQFDAEIHILPDEHS